jgi:PDZ domain
MSSPRHLWSGDWQLDSAAVADELAKRRAQTDDHADSGPEAPPPSSGPSARDRIGAWLRRARRGLATLIAHARTAIGTALSRVARLKAGRRLGVVLVVVIVTLLSAGVAFAVTSLLVGSGGNGSSSASADRVWLGAGLTSSPFASGAMVTTVAPGSPADRAGLESGDVITQINNQPIGAPGDVSSALAGLHPGNQIQVQFNRGQASFSTLVTLAARPHGTP